MGSEAQALVAGNEMLGKSEGLDGDADDVPVTSRFRGINTN